MPLLPAIWYTSCLPFITHFDVCRYVTYERRNDRKVMRERI